MEHISVSANQLLEKIAKRRVGRAMEALDLSGADDLVKSAVKKQMWQFFEDVKSQVLESEGKNDKEYNI